MSKAKQPAPHPGETIVYVLGAGFSRPLGLPLVSDFLEMARAQHAENPVGYRKFAAVFARIKDLSQAFINYAGSTHNIEDVLSLIEMQDKLSGREGKRLISEFICDVVRAHTPPVPISLDPVGLPWPNALRSCGGAYKSYVTFVAALLGLEYYGSATALHERDRTRWQVNVRRAPGPRYAVITLNYDQVLERALECLHSWVPSTPNFSRAKDQPRVRRLRLPESGVVLAKLHGDVGTGQIVPPTWSKGSRDNPVWPEWRLAYAALAEATQIRVIGYSLADSDSYIRYLLRAAALESDRLKRFDVLCLDPNASTRRRYEEFVHLPGFNFRNTSVESFLNRLGDPIYNNPGGMDGTLTYAGLAESAHTQVLKEHQ